MAEYVAEVRFKGAHRDPLIGMGSAPLGNLMFRAAMFEQLGESKLEGAVTTDIIGKKDSHATDSTPRRSRAFARQGCTAW